MPPRKKIRLSESTVQTSLIDSTGRQHSFLWVIWDFRRWPAGQGFNLKSSVFTRDGKKFQVCLNYVGDFLEPSLYLMTKQNKPLNASIKFSILGMLFRKCYLSEKSYVFRHQHQVCEFPTYVPQHDLLDEDKKLCFNGDLVLLCEVTLFEFDSSYFEISQDVSSNLKVNLGNLLENKVCPDFVIQVEDQQFMCHKAVLSCRSEFFRNMFLSNMKEKQENKLTISDIDPFIIQKMLQYIYTGHVDILSSDTVPLLAAADRYGLERLQSLCEVELNFSLWEGNALYIYKLASTFNVPKLRLRAERLLLGFKNEVGGWHYYRTTCCDVDNSNESADVAGPSSLPNNDSTDEETEPVSEVTIAGYCNPSVQEEIHQDTELSIICHISPSGKIPSNKDDIIDVPIAGPSTVRQLPAKHKFFDRSPINGPLRPEDIPPAADVWCCTKNHLLSNMKWRIKDMHKICEAKTLNIKSLQFYSKDKDTNETATWQVGISMVERRNLLGPPLKYLSLQLACITSTSMENTVDFKFNILTCGKSEKYPVNGMHRFRANDMFLVNEYYILVDDILENMSLLHNHQDLILCCQLMKRKSFLFDAIEPIIVPKCDLSTDILSLLTSKSYCDIVISVEDILFDCHKAILMVASPYLATIIQEGQCSEDKGLFKIPDMKADVFEVLRWFIYSGICKECDEFKLIPEANKFGLTNMKTVLEERLISNLCIKNAAKALVFADMNTCSKLRAECLQFISLYLKEVMGTSGWIDVVRNDTLLMECLKTPYAAERFTDNEVLWIDGDTGRRK